MTVGADKSLAGLAKTLQMDLMADTVAGTGEPNTVLGGDGLQITVVITVFKTALQGIMVHVGNTQFCLNPGNSHGLEFQIRHGTGGILCQGLINSQGNLAACGHGPGNQMTFNDLLRNCLSHFTSRLSSCNSWHC